MSQDLETQECLEIQAILRQHNIVVARDYAHGTLEYEVFTNPDKNGDTTKLGSLGKKKPTKEDILNFIERIKFDDNEVSKVNSEVVKQMKTYTPESYSDVLEKKYGLNKSPYNYLKLKSTNIGICSYAYIDSIENRADSLFVANEIPVSFDNDYIKGKFKCILCRFEKEYEEKFLKCMNNLFRIHFMRYGKEYEKMCEDTLALLKPKAN